MRLVEFLSAKQFRKLNEILSNNQIIINLKDMQIEFEDEFSLIEQSHDLLLKMKSLTRHRRLLGNIDNLRVLIQPFLDYDFDPDPDIDVLKNRGNQIMQQLDIIESQIP